MFNTEALRRGDSSMSDDRSKIGIYYFRVEGLPGSLNAYHAGVYHSYLNENGNRVTETWDAGPTDRNPGLSGYVEGLKELYAPGPDSPYGPIIVKHNFTPENDAALGNRIVLPDGAIPGPELLTGSRGDAFVSGAAGKIASTFDEIAKGKYLITRSYKIRIRPRELH
jgi:hypothetical protein